MKRIIFFFISIMVIVVASACTVMEPIESGSPNSGVGQSQSGPLNPGQGEAPVSDGGPISDGVPANSGSAGGGAQPNPGGAGVEQGEFPAQGSVSDEQFDAALAQAIQAKDLVALRGMMGSSFTLAGWRSEGSQLSPEDAIALLRQSALSAGATPAARFNVDTVALLDFADPLKFFPPDAVRAFLVESLGTNGADEALVIVGRDPVSGQRYWKGLLVAMGGFRQGNAGGKTDLEQFSALLAQAVEQRDFSAMRGLMRERFSIATFNASLYEYPSDEALDKLRAGIFASGSAPVFRAGTDVVALLSGRDPLGEWGPVANPVHAVHVMGLGSSGGDEALLVIGRDAATGQLYWHGVLLPPNGRHFRADDISDDVLPTDVRYVEALDELNARSGPGLNYAVEGKLRSGEIATVTGKSPDSAWWRISCTQDASGHCWISARADLTRPVQN